MSKKIGAGDEEVKPHKFFRLVTQVEEVTEIPISNSGKHHTRTRVDVERNVEILTRSLVAVTEDDGGELDRLCELASTLRWLAAGVKTKKIDGTEQLDPDIEKGTQR